MRPNFRSLSVKVQAWLALGLGLCFAGLILHLSVSKLGALMALGEEASRNQTILVAGQSRAGIEARDEAYLEDIYFDLVFGQREDGFANPRISMLRAFGAGGGTLKSFETLRGPHVAPEELEALARAAMREGAVGQRALGDLLVIAAPVVDEFDGTVVGAIAIAWDHAHLRAAVLASTLWHAALGLAGAVAMILALGLAIRRLVLTPLGRLALAVEGMEASGELTALPPDVLDRRDEIGGLAVRFQRLLGQLAAARASLLARTGELERQRERLDAALENMSQGLCMFDAEGRLVVHNRRFLEIHGLLAEAAAPGTHARDLPHLGAQAAPAPAPSDGAAPGLDGVEVAADGRILAVTRVPMAGGGWVATFEDVTTRRRAEMQVEHMALHDALTGLPNRVRFRRELQRALGQLPPGGTLAVLALDLDRFKAVNDTLGHPVGDALLQDVAARLGSCLRPLDLAARLGGDEFAVVAAVATAEAAGGLAERMIAALSAPYDVAGHQVSIGASVGIALAPQDGCEPDELVKAADLALYRAKADGRGVVRFFAPEMDAEARERRALELDLRQALRNGELALHFQPILNVETGEVSCLEALLRWRHPIRGAVPPDRFIPVAEEVGLINQIGAWVLREACQAAARWPAEVGVAVNLSAVQFRSEALIHEVDAALDAAGLDPRRLELEITEAVLLQQTDLTLAILGRLRAMGVRVSMDDFGTGCSSLSYLRAFPFDKIKIDRSFVQDLTTRDDALAIIRAISGLGVSLSIATTAEGVETPEQFDKLRLEGCTEVQGYLFSPAVEADAVSALLDRLRSARPPATRRVAQG